MRGKAGALKSDWPTRLWLWIASRRGQSRLFGLAGLLLAGLTIFASSQWVLIALSASAPWIALAVNRVSDGELGFERWLPFGQPRWKRIIPRFWDSAMYPMTALVALGLTGFNPVDLAPFVAIPLFVGGVLAALFFALVIWARPKRKRNWWYISLGTIGFVAYAFGCMSLLNGMLPQAPPSQFEARISSKYIKNVRNQPRMFVLGPWGPFSGGDVQVSLVMYDRLQPGDSVCMLLHPGALGFPWWEITSWSRYQADPHYCPDLPR